MAVSKKELAKTIHKKLGLSQKDSLFFTSTFFEYLKTNHDNDINIHRFGSFAFRETPQRTGRNPKTREEFIIKKRKKVIFKPSEEIKKRIN